MTTPLTNISGRVILTTRFSISEKRNVNGEIKKPKPEKSIIPIILIGIIDRKNSALISKNIQVVKIISILIVCKKNTLSRFRKIKVKGDMALLFIMLALDRIAVKGLRSASIYPCHSINPNTTKRAYGSSFVSFMTDVDFLRIIKINEYRAGSKKSQKMLNFRELYFRF